MRNPFVVGLAVLTGIVFAVSVILFIIAATQNVEFGDSVRVTQGVYLALGYDWLKFGGVFLLATLVVAGLRWTSSGSQPERAPRIHRGISAVDAALDSRRRAAEAAANAAATAMPTPTPMEPSTNTTDPA